MDKSKPLDQSMEKLVKQISEIESQVQEISFSFKFYKKQVDQFENKIASQKKTIMDEFQPVIEKIKNDFRQQDGNLGKKVHAHNSEIEIIQKRLGMLDNNLKETRQQLNEKANIKKIIQIDQTIDNDLVKKIKFDEFKENSQKIFEKNKFNIKLLFQKIDEFKEEYAQKILSLDQISSETQKSLNKQIQIIKENTQEITILENNIEYIQGHCKYMNDNFELKKNFQELKARFDIFSDFESTQQLRDIFIPKINGFLGHMDKMMGGYEMMSECIRKFDEDLSLKSDKSQLLVLKKEVEANYIQQDYKNQIDLKFNKLDSQSQQKVYDFENKMELMMSSYLQKNQKIIQDEVELKLEKYQQVAKSFQQFFGQDELSALIDRRADLELFRRLQDQKANRQEIQDLAIHLTQIDEQIRHISVLQAEIAESLQPLQGGQTFKKIDDLHSNIYKRKMLFNHAKVLCNWIHKQNGDYDIQKFKQKHNKDIDSLKNKDRYVSVENKTQDNLFSSKGCSIDLSGSSINSNKDSLGKNQVYLTGSTSKNRQTTLQIIKSIQSDRARPMSEQQDFSKTQQNKNNAQKNLMIMSDSILSGSQNQKITDNSKQNEKDLLLSQRKSKNIDLNCRSPIGVLRNAANLQKITFVNQNLPKKNNSKLKLFSTGEEIKKHYLTNIQYLEESKKLQSTDIPIASDQDKQIEKNFIKFEEQKKTLRMISKLAKPIEQESCCSSTPKVLSLRPKFINKNNKTNQQIYVPQTNVNFQTLVELSKEIQEKNRNENRQYSPSLLSNYNFENTQRVFSQGQFRKSKIREQISNNFSLGKSLDTNVQQKTNKLVIIQSDFNNQISMFDQNACPQSHLQHKRVQPKQDSQNNIFS